MNADHLSYHRATVTSVFGLCFQIAFAVALLLYGIFGRDPAAMSGAYALLLGAPIWVALALVTHQHRLERIEAMEAEAFASSAAAEAAVFQDTATSGENQQAAKLDWMHRWFLPSLSLVLAVASIALGITLFIRDRDLAAADPYTAPALSGWGIAIGVVIAGLSFVFARFVAGMAKQKVWSLLNAGAATQVAASVIGAAIFVGHFVANVLNDDIVIRYLPLAIDALMVLLGAEIGLNFVLNLYRPRRTGEYLRPAFDSRVLAFLAAPDKLAESISDAINYQFGFDVSSTWFYQLVSRSIIRLAALGLAILWLMSAFAVVQPNERGLVLRGGEIRRAVGSGLVLKRPWPLERITTFPASVITQINAGSRTISSDDAAGPILWTNTGSESDAYLIVRATAANEGDAQQDPEAGLALVGVDVPVQYVVGDLQRYLDLAQDGPASDRERMRRELLTGLASSAVLATLAQRTIDDVLGAERLALAEELKRRIQRVFDHANAGAGAGVEVVFVGLQQARPPKDAAPVFEAVVAAEFRSRAGIEEARAEAIREFADVAGDHSGASDIIRRLDTLEGLRADAGADAASVAQAEDEILSLIVASGGQAAQDVSHAQRQRWVDHMTQRAEALRSQGRVDAYKVAPEAYLAKLYIDALLDMFTGVRVLITPPGVHVELDQTELNADIGGFTPAELEEE